LVAALLEKVVWQPKKRLWIIQCALAGGLFLSFGLIYPWQSFSLGVLKQPFDATITVIDLHKAEPLPNSFSNRAPNHGILPGKSDAQTVVVKTVSENQNREGIAELSSAYAPPIPSIYKRSIIGWPPILVGYMFGSLAMLCWLLAGVWKVHRIIRRAAPPCNDLRQVWFEVLSGMAEVSSRQ
jgi:hypothetical protein